MILPPPHPTPQTKKSGLIGVQLGFPSVLFRIAFSFSKICLIAEESSSLLARAAVVPCTELIGSKAGAGAGTGTRQCCDCHHTTRQLNYHCELDWIGLEDGKRWWPEPRPLADPSSAEQRRKMRLESVCWVKHEPRTPSWHRPPPPGSDEQLNSPLSQIKP